MFFWTDPEKTPSWKDLFMILVIGSIRTSRQSFIKLVGNGSRSLEVLFNLMINFLISVSVVKGKVFIKKNMSNEGWTFRSSLSSGNFINKKVWEFFTNCPEWYILRQRGSRKSMKDVVYRFPELLWIFSIFYYDVSINICFCFLHNSIAQIALNSVTWSIAPVTGSAPNSFQATSSNFCF